MSRWLPFRTPGLCIDCAAEIGRHAETWRCVECQEQMEVTRVSAILTLRKAIRGGVMPPARGLACVDCEADAHDYDHRSYLRPLDVEPVCRKCNQRRGPALWRNYAEA